MAENNEYKITIENKTKKTAKSVGGAGGINAQKSADGGENLGTTSTGTSADSTDKAQNALLRLFSVSSGVNNTMRAIAFDVSQVTVETGSREAQQRANALYSGASALVHVGGAAAAGGPAFAGVAILQMLISKATSIIFQMNAIENQSRLQDITRDLSAQRSTVSGSRYMTAKEY